MSNFLKQFFGDAKRIKLSSTEKANAWQALAGHIRKSPMPLSTREKADLFHLILRYMKAHPMTRDAHPVRSFFTFHRFAAVAMCAVLLMGVGGGAAYAAESAMPDDLLYPIKIHFNEPLVSAISITPEQKADWEARRLERRMREAEHVSQAKGFTPARRAVLQERIEVRMEFVERHLETLPEEKRVVLEERIDTAMEQHEAFLQNLEDGTVSPGEVREFKERVHDMRVKAHERWSRSLPPGLVPGDLPKPFERLLEERRSSDAMDMVEDGEDEDDVDEHEEEGEDPPDEQQDDEQQELIEDVDFLYQENTDENDMQELLPPVELPAEGWPSGRWRSPRKRVGPYRSRGFESRPLRQDDEQDEGTEDASDDSSDDAPEGEDNADQHGKRENDKAPLLDFLRSRHPFFNEGASDQSD